LKWLNLIWLLKKGPEHTAQSVQKCLAQTSNCSSRPKLIRISIVNTNKLFNVYTFEPTKNIKFMATLRVISKYFENAYVSWQHL
jgi:hypothetical protein